MALDTDNVTATNGYFGAATPGAPAVTWVSSYWTGAEWPGDHALLAVSAAGMCAGLFASRSSDNGQGSESDVITLGVETVNDGTGIAHSTWGIYNEGRTIASSTALEHFNEESSIFNGWPTVDNDPYTQNRVGLVTNLRLDCWGPNRATDAIEIVGNSDPITGYRAGITIGSTALDTDNGRVAPAIQMAARHSLDWFSGPGQLVGRLYHDGNNFVVKGLPNADPHVVNALWSNGGVLMVSAG